MTKIYYFSGTGNSLYIAKQLSKEIDSAEIVPMVGEIKHASKSALSKSIGLVFPVHAFSMPTVVKAFLQQASFDKDTYIFAVATRMGSSCKVFEDINKILLEKGVRLSSKWFINMPNNYLSLLPMSNEEEVKILGEAADKKVAEISAIIKSKSFYEEVDPHYSYFEKNILFSVLNKIYTATNYFGLENKFYADDKCTNCSLCSKICLAEKIKMKDNKPIWEKDVSCYHCFACIHYCPVAAIQINNKTKKCGRYHHFDAKSNEILEQKA